MDRIRGADLGTLRTLRAAVSAFVGHLGLHQPHQVARRAQHLVRTDRHAELAGRAAGEEVAQAPRTGRAIGYADLYELGLSGTPGAAGVRRRVLQRAGLPPRLSKKALCAALSSLYTYEEFRALCTAVEEEQEA